MAGGLPRLVVAAALTMSSAARAQVATDEFGIERFRLPMSSSGLLDVDWADVPGHLSWSAGVWVGFAHDPLVIYDENMNQIDSLVGQRVTTGLVGSIGLWSRLELGLSADIVGYQAGADVTPVMSELPKGGLGDLRVAAKVLVLGGIGSRLHVSIVPVLTVPAGAAGGYLRESGPTFAPEVAVAGTWGRLRGGGNAGYVIRERVDDAGLIIDDEIFVRAGVGMQLGSPESATEVAVSVSLAMPVRDVQANQVALATMVGGSRKITSAVGVFVAAGFGLDNGFGVPDWRALAGVRLDGLRGDRDGDGLVGSADRCPNDAEDKDGFADNDGCPDPDNDGDGIADAVDRCPTQAEDRDGVQDADGCPDVDGDNDGVADERDKCPAAAEDKDGFADDDGCPDPSGKLTGKVLGPDGRGVAATLVVEYPESPGTAPTEATSSDDGSFTIAVHGGAYKLTTRGEAYQETTSTGRVEPNGTANVSVTVARKVRQGQLRGQVLSFDGKPLAATITVTGKTNTTATTDAQGFFSVDLPAGAFDVSIESKGHATQQRKVNVKLDGVTVLNVDMRRGP